MSYGIKLRVWGDYAAFNRPEFKTERCSYDIITPSAARGILEAIYWHPGMKYHVDKIYVCKPIAFTTIRRNEVTSKISCDSVFKVMEGNKKPLYLNTHDPQKRAQRSSLLLRDVEYVIEAHFSMTRKPQPDANPDKYLGEFADKAREGKCFHTPYFGTREFPVKFSLCEDGEKIQTAYEGEKDLGFMLYDLDYSDPKNIQPMFFRAVMRDGIVDVGNSEVLR